MCARNSSTLIDGGGELVIADIDYSTWKERKSVLDTVRDPDAKNTMRDARRECPDLRA